MASMVIWMLGIAFSISVMIVTAAQSLYYVHMAVAALVSVVVALASFQEARAVPSGRSDLALQASSNFRYMGMVWTWGALGLLVTYSFILSWREWWQFFIGFALLAGLCLFISATLRNDAEKEASDATMFKIAYGLALFFMIAMVITMCGLVIDGKMWRFTTRAGLRPGWQDWAANNIFFFGAMALAAISWNATRVLKKLQ